MTGTYRWNRWLSMLVTAGLAAGLTAGCHGNTTSQTTAPAGTESSAALPSETEAAAEELGLDLEFTARDLDVGYEETTAVAVQFQEETVTVDGEGAGVTGTTVTIDQEGTYVISGESENGRIIINAGDSDKIQLVFAGISLHCPNNSPVYIKNADKVFLTLEEGTENSLSDGGTYQLSEEDQKVDAVIYSKADLTINGSGALNVTAVYKHGIASKDDLVITGGALTVTAEGKGLYGKDCVKIKDGAFVLNTGGDGIQSDNAEEEGKGFVYIAGGSFDITSQKDGIQAETVLRVDDGEFQIVSGGGSANAPAREEKGKGMFGGRSGDQDLGGANEGNPPGDGSMPGFQGGPGGRNGGGGLRRRGQDQTGTGTEAAGDTDTASAPIGTSSADTTTSATEESKKGLKAGTSLILNGGSYEIDTADDSVHSNGTVTVSAGNYTLKTGDDGIHGDGAVVITGGEISIEQCYEGIEGQSVTIEDGTISIVSSDDGINAADGSSTGGMGRPGSGNENCVITIKGGTITINASADGIDSNGDFYMEGGTLLINGPDSGGDGALDYDGEGVITGGTVIAVGSSGMAQGFSNTSTQNSILYGFESWAEAGDTVRLTDENGSVLAEFVPEKRYNSAVISVPGLELNKTYVLEAGDQKSEITITSAATSNLQQMGGGMGGMGHGGSRGDRGSRDSGAAEAGDASPKSTEN